MTASDDWIQQSLETLEALEDERKVHEAALEAATDPTALRMHSQALESLEAEIQSLYQQLEAVADGGEVEEEEVEEPAPAEVYREPEPIPVAQAVDFGAPASPPADFGAPASPPAGFGAPTPGGFDSLSSPPPSLGGDFGGGGDFDDFEKKSKGGAAKWVIIAAVVLGGGLAGGYFMMNKEPPPAQAPQGTSKVISAGDIPPDTQGPKVAKGADVDESSGTRFKKGPERAHSGGGGGGGSSSGAKKKKKDPEHTITKTDDPLAGIDK